MTAYVLVLLLGAAMAYVGIAALVGLGVCILWHVVWPVLDVWLRPFVPQAPRPALPRAIASSHHGDRS
jgi:hypothetical protein